MPPKKIAPRKTTSPKATIYKLAEETGFSPSTVSRALRNQPEIGVATRELIRKHADRMGFKLRVFESRIINICALIQTQSGQTSLFSSFVEAIMDGMWQYCTENDLELSVFGAEAERLSSGDLGRVLGRRGVSGAVVINASEDSRFLGRLTQERFPYACVATAPKEGLGTLVTGKTSNSRSARSRSFARSATEGSLSSTAFRSGCTPASSDAKRFSRRWPGRNPSPSRLATSRPRRTTTSSLGARRRCNCSPGRSLRPPSSP